MENDWLYRRVYIDSYEGTQLVLEHLVDGVQQLARCILPGSRWHFLRFVDHGGYQVRLRHRGPLGALAAFEAASDDFIADAVGRQPLRSIYRGSGKSLYQPEHVKYGGRAGVDKAELAFQDGSEVVLQLLAREQFWASRFGYAALLTWLTTGLLPPDSRTSFLYNIAWYWCGGNAAARRPVRVAAAKSAEAVHRRMQQLKDDGADLLLRRHVDVLASSLVNTTVPRQPANLLFHAVHMNNNRLGIKPIEEAVIAEILLDAKTAKGRMRPALPSCE